MSLSVVLERHIRPRLTRPIERRDKCFVLTIDVEPDAGTLWKTSNPISFKGVFDGIPRIQEVSAAYGIKPTYLLSPVILKSDECVAFLRQMEGELELGTHLHGEYVEPHARFPGPDFSGCDPSEKQCDYSEQLEFLKLKTLTELFADRFGYRPKSFRAGRFGARGWTIHCLRTLEYTHDSSVTPFHKQFSRARFSSPYYASTEDILEPVEDGIVEVPISITPGGLWLRPTPGYSELPDLQLIVDWYEKTLDEPVLCCMFHNVELIPGASPYNATTQECSRQLARLESLYQLLRSRGYEFLLLGEVEAA